MPEMTPIKAAEKLEIVKEMSFPSYAKLIQPAIDYLRKIANGEYKQVVHGRWIKEWSDAVGVECCCSECAAVDKNGSSEHCPSCGVLMDGEDDNHAEIH